MSQNHARDPFAESGDGWREHPTAVTVGADHRPTEIDANPSPNSFHSPRESGERNESDPYTLVSIADLGPAEEPDWLWQGYIARGAITLLTGLWKSGKTTLMSNFLRDLYRGVGLVGVPMNAPTIYLSEESKGLWRNRRDALALPPAIKFVIRKNFARPNAPEWCRIINKMVVDVRRLDAGLVVIDTLPSFWPVANENDASEVVQALAPLRALTDSGAAVLLIHHPRKQDGAEATATRGSGALPGFVDVIVELRRHSPADEADKRRLLKAYGRFESTPAEQVIELTGDGYRMLGERPAVHEADKMGTIAGVLPAASPGMNWEEVKDAWPTDPKPGNTHLRALLERGLAEGKWARSGGGKKGDAFRYHRAANGSNSFQSPPSLSERNESDSLKWGET